MAMDELAERLAEGAAGIEALRSGVIAGEPWPLSDAYGEEPEADWGPKEALAHVAEMLTYWLGQVEIVVAAPAGGPPPSFGRVATDADRIGRIGADRRLPADELFDHIASAAAVARHRMRELTPDQIARTGVHPTLGEFRVEAMFERFMVGHLEGHVRQLTEVLARD